MRESICKEYKLGTILNVITGVNKLSTNSEFRDILEFFNGSPFPDYELMKIALEVRNKIIFHNREFINVDMLELKAMMGQNGDNQLAINNWLSRQEQVFGSTFLVSHKGEVIRKDAENDNNKVIQEKPLQLVKRVNSSNSLKISI